jgi:transcriptional regulator with XRE-family HTH domain
MWAFRPADWGHLARDRRVDLGLSQAALAAQAGVSRQWVNRFEGGKGTGAARLDAALRVMDLLGFAVDIRPDDSEPPR